MATLTLRAVKGTPLTNNEMDANLSVLNAGRSEVQETEHDNGNSGAAFEVDWANGPRQSLTLTDDCTITFVDPTYLENMTLRLVQDGTGSRTATFSGNFKWASGVLPSLTTTAASIDFISIYFDGTNYNCTTILDFKSAGAAT